MNDMAISMEHGGPRAITTTIWWVVVALYMLIVGIQKGARYKSEKLLGLLLLALTVGKILLYDLATMGMQNKIIVLMIVGGALMMFSYGVHTKGWLKQTEEEEIPKAPTPKQKEEPKDTESAPENKTNRTINEKIKDIDIGNTVSAIFTVTGGKIIKIKSKNLIRISKLIIKNAGRSSFKPNELQPIYEQISKGYETELSATDYKKIMGVMKEFVEVGGEVSFE